VNTSFYKNTAKLMSGNVIGQLIGIISIPLIARLFGVEAFGVFASVLAFSLILSGVSTLGLHLAILIPKSDYEAKRIASLSMTIIFALSLILSVVIFVYNKEVSTLLNLESMQWIVFSMPALVMSQSVYLVLSYYSVRKKEFWLVSITGVAVGLVDRVSAIGAAFLGFVSPLTLVISRVLSNVVSSIGLLFYTSREKCETPVIELSNGDLVKRYKKYIIFNTPSTLMMNTTAQLPTLLLTAMISPVAAGLYAMAARVASIPVIAIGGALSKTYMQKISESHSSGDSILIEGESKKLLFNVFSYGLIPFTLLSVMGGYIFTLFLGSEWGEAGNLLVGLSFLAFTTLIVQTFGGIFDVYKQQEKRLAFHTANFIVKLGVLLICLTNEMSIQTTIVSFSVAALVMNIIVLQVLFSILGIKFYVFKIVIINGIFLLVYFCSIYVAFGSVDNFYLKSLGEIFIAMLWGGAVFRFQNQLCDKEKV
jgi:O-antigen/teichoic acid export membrane protein